MIREKILRADGNRFAREISRKFFVSLLDEACVAFHIPAHSSFAHLLCVAES